MASQVLADTIATMTKTKGVLESATVFVNGLPAKIQAAIDKALANGASEAELQPLVDLRNAVETDADALVTAMATNP